jgi:hypothetical protein
VRGMDRDVVVREAESGHSLTGDDAVRWEMWPFLRWQYKLLGTRPTLTLFVQL